MHQHCTHWRSFLFHVRSVGWRYTFVGTHTGPPSGQRQREDERGCGGHENKRLLMTSEVDGAVTAGMR